MVVGSEGQVLFVNQAWQQLHPQATKRFGQDVVHLNVIYATTYQVLCGDTLSEEARQAVQAVIDGTSDGYETVCVDTLGHQARTLKLTVTPLGAGCGGAVLRYEDLSEQKRREAEIYTSANLDPLTGLYNRRLFFLEADKVLALAERQQHPFALLYLDLDNFKAVNDAFGHDVGDELLQQAALRLKGLLRESDLLARLGGDEFLLLLPETDVQESLLAVARYRACLTQPFLIRGISLTLEGSFGLAHYPADGQTLTDLVRLADQAMYQAKVRGGGVWVHGSADENRAEMAEVNHKLFSTASPKS